MYIQRYIVYTLMYNNIQYTYTHIGIHTTVLSPIFLTSLSMFSKAVKSPQDSSPVYIYIYMYGVYKVYE